MGINRRAFMGRLVQISGFALLAPSIFRSAVAVGAEAGAKIPMLDPKASNAMGVKYVTDAKKSKMSKGNKCATCQFFTQKEKRDGKDVGACLIFPGTYVYASGFCNSWTKKA